MDSTTPRQMVLGYKKKQNEQAMESLFSVLCLNSCLQVTELGNVLSSLHNEL